MIHQTRMPSLGQVYEIFDDPRYLESKGPDHEAYGAMANRLHDFQISPETWPAPEPFQLGQPLALKLPAGAGGINHPRDVADLSDGLLSFGSLGLSGWLPRTTVPNSKLNAAIVGFQRLNDLKPDGLVNPDGPTITVLNGYLPLPQAPDPRPQTAPLPGRGIGDTLTEARAEEARFEAGMAAEASAENPFGDIFAGRGEDPTIANHVDKWLAEDEAGIRAQRERDAAIGAPNPAVEQLDDAIGDAGADRLAPRPSRFLRLRCAARHRLDRPPRGGGIGTDRAGAERCLEKARRANRRVPAPRRTRPLNRSAEPLYSAALAASLEGTA
jgi:hypothetical protein